MFCNYIYIFFSKNKFLYNYFKSENGNPQPVITRNVKESILAKILYPDWNPYTFQKKYKTRTDDVILHDVFPELYIKEKNIEKNIQAEK